MVTGNWSEMTCEQWRRLTRGQWGGGPDPAALCRGDGEQWRRWIASQFDRLVRIARPIVGDSDARDAVQDVLARLWRRRSTLGAVEDVERYVSVAVRNQAVTILRRERKQWSVIHVAAIEGALDPPGELPETVRDRLAALRDVPQDLTPAQRAIFDTLRADTDASKRAVGRKLGCSHTNVLASLRRIRRAILRRQKARQRSASGLGEFE
jgi:RNA polymerase sigma factor (sigma-70 family)